MYVGDMAVWGVRAKLGGGMDKVTVSRFVVAPLTDNKEEYYLDGTAEVACSRSLLSAGRERGLLVAQAASGGVRAIRDCGGHPCARPRNEAAIAWTGV